MFLEKFIDGATLSQENTSLDINNAGSTKSIEVDAACQSIGMEHSILLSGLLLLVCPLRHSLIICVVNDRCDTRVVWQSAADCC
jgi:hypothetical protein